MTDARTILRLHSQPQSSPSRGVGLEFSFTRPYGQVVMTYEVIPTPESGPDDYALPLQPGWSIRVRLFDAWGTALPCEAASEIFSRTLEEA